MPTVKPGSPAAIRMGCKCPVLDNNNGRGIGLGKFWISADCPIHGDNRAEGAKEGEHDN